MKGKDCIYLGQEGIVGLEKSSCSMSIGFPRFVVFLILCAFNICNFSTLCR